MNKICKVCGVEKELSDFRKDKRAKDGFRNECKKCYAARMAEKRKNNPKMKEYNRDWWSKYKEQHKEWIRDYQHQYYSENRNTIIQRNLEYKKNNRDKYNARLSERIKEEPLFKLKLDIRSRIRKSIKNQGYSKDKRTEEILGCSIEYFQSFIENQFQEGMSWENHGEWHLDHIIPNETAKGDEEKLYRLNHYTNFQPLWKEENLSKSNRVRTEDKFKVLFNMFGEAS